ncbi:MAG: glycosyltransferase family 2 protein [Candidatus Poribacteria bacterium]|nr:glycosyltransferase family 2 protein [Candidatus Poribacteria bacterium]
MTLISIVIPAYNEAESLPNLLSNIHATVKAHGYLVEVILINDGSTDATVDVLITLAAELPLHVHVIHFRRNRGKAEALTAGFQKATGDLVITMDADLQDDPAEIPKLIDTLEKGNYGLVSGWKYPRKDPFEKRAFSFIFNRVTAMFTGVKLHDMNCGFKAYRAEVVKELHLYGDLHRYIPILAQAAGFSVGEVKVKHHPRQFGKSKYGFKRIPKGFFDLLTVLFLTRYKKRPMHFFAGIGSLFTFSGILLLAGLTALHFFPIIEIPRLLCGIAGGFCIVTGILLSALGLFGELLVAFLTHKGKE